jgi:hypothetical protein
MFSFFQKFQRMWGGIKSVFGVVSKNSVTHSVVEQCCEIYEEDPIEPILED